MCKAKIYGLLTKCKVKIYGLLTNCEVKILYGLLTKCEVKMAGYWEVLICVFMDRNGIWVHTHAKK